MSPEMQESNVYIANFLRDLWLKLSIYFSRPDVQTQLLAILVLLVLLSIVATLLRTWIRPTPLKHLPYEPDDQVQPRRFGRVIRIAIGLLIYPVLGIIATTYTIPFVPSQSKGLLELFLSILWMMLSFRIVVGVLYLLLDEGLVSRLYNRILNPLFGLYITYIFARLVINVQTTAEVILNQFADSPLTLGALFIATVGLYFWIDGIAHISEIVSKLSKRYSNVNAGRLDAALTLGGYILIFVGVVVALSVLGVDSTVFAAILGGLSVGIGFGLQAILSNFVSGILMLFEGAIRPGDYLSIEGEWVEVTKLGVNNTLVRSFDGFEIIVPNQELLSSTVTTFTGSDNLYRFRLTVKTTFAPDINLMLTVLTKVVNSMVEQDPAVLEKPAPGVMLHNINDDDVITYKADLWLNIREASWPVLRTMFYNRLVQEMEQHDIDIAALDIYAEEPMVLMKEEGLPA